MQTSVAYHRTLTHSEPVGQVVWYIICPAILALLLWLTWLIRSPSGSLLLTKFSHSIKVWTEVSSQCEYSSPFSLLYIRRVNVIKQLTASFPFSQSAGFLVEKVGPSCGRFYTKDHDRSLLQRLCPLRGRAFISWLVIDDFIPLTSAQQQHIHVKDLTGQVSTPSC